MKTGKKLLCIGIAVFLMAFVGITAADRNQSIASPAAQQSSQSLLNPNFDPEAEIKTSQKIVRQLLSLIGADAPSEETATKAVVSTSPAPDFSDVKETDWFYREVMWAVGENITNGVSDSQFGPDVICTNAQVLTFLWRAYGMPRSSAANPFTDVSADSYFYQPALWAYEKRLVSGSTLSPDEDCTRAMAVNYLWRASGAPAAIADTQFSDVPASSSVSQAVAWAVDNGIAAGIDRSTFSPDASCTRAQIVTFLYRNYISSNASDETFKLSSGASYTGKAINGVPYGKGILVIPEVGYYDGEFQDGKRSGTGSFFWDSGETYTGSWKEDKIFGEGIFSLNAGTTLTGKFSDGRMSSGTYTLSQDFGRMEVSVSE